MRAPPSLLHNMSAPPTTTVRYAGLGTQAESSASVSKVSTSKKSSAKPINPRAFGVAVHFAIEQSMTSTTAIGILRRLKTKPGSNADATLAALIETRAAEFPLPDGCLLMPRHSIELPASTVCTLWPDLLSTLAVLSKCSDHVWLRAKSPSLSAALTRRSATLFVPPQLAHLLPLEHA